MDQNQKPLQKEEDKSSSRRKNEANRTLIKEDLRQRFDEKESAKQRTREKDGVQVDRNKALKRSRQDAKIPPNNKQQEQMQPVPGEVQVAVVLEGSPTEIMEPDMLNDVENAITEAYDKISDDRTQVCIERCEHKTGHLLITCADEESAMWLSQVVPDLSPKVGARLKVLEGDDLPGRYKCTSFIPYKNGQTLEAERILHRLRVGNRKLVTNLWTVKGQKPGEKGQKWTFAMDKQSMEELKKMDMFPYFGVGRIKFQDIDAKSKNKVAQGTSRPKQRKSVESENPQEQPGLFAV